MFNVSSGYTAIKMDRKFQNIREGLRMRSKPKLSGVLNPYNTDAII